MSDRSEPEHSEGSSFAAAALDVLESMGPIIDSAAGYREKCIAAGFNETAAEMMALQYHQALMLQIVGVTRG